MGLNNIIYSAIDYMLGTISLTNYLLFIPYYYSPLALLSAVTVADSIQAGKGVNNNYLRDNLDASGSFNLLLNSEIDNYVAIKSNNTDIQSAENCTGFSETIRQLFNSEEKFYRWLAGIIDGDGNFDIRKSTSPNSKQTLKSIRIKLHNRDIRILTRIQNYLHFGVIRVDKHKPYSIYTVSRFEDKLNLITKLNGLIKIKTDGFKKACSLFNIEYIEPDYNITPYDPYFAGLIDTDGSIVFNYTGNRIECNLEFKYNKYTSKLNLDNVIPNYKPYLLLRTHSSNKTSQIYKSIAFKFQSVKGMVPLYDYFMVNRLYSDFKFYRVTQIKRFIEIRDFQKSDFESVEFQIYSNFLLDWIQYKNPLWTKVPFVKKLRIK